MPGTDTLTDIRPGQLRERAYEDKQRTPDDMEAQEGQRRIAIHGLENLGLIDSGIAANRRKLHRAVQDGAEGRDPPNIFRNPATNRMIETSCWNTVVAPGRTVAARGVVA